MVSSVLTFRLDSSLEDNGLWTERPAVLTYWRWRLITVTREACAVLSGYVYKFFVCLFLKCSLMLGEVRYKQQKQQEPVFLQSNTSDQTALQTAGQVKIQTVGSVLSVFFIIFFFIMSIKRIFWHWFMLCYLLYKIGRTYERLI